jgi:hypothetical protein
MLSATFYLWYLTPNGLGHVKKDANIYLVAIAVVHVLLAWLINFFLHDKSKRIVLLRVVLSISFLLIPFRLWNLDSTSYTPHESLLAFEVALVMIGHAVVCICLLLFLLTLFVIAIPFAVSWLNNIWLKVIGYCVIVLALYLGMDYATAQLSIPPDHTFLDSFSFAVTSLFAPAEVLFHQIIHIALSYLVIHLRAANKV